MKFSTSNALFIIIIINNIHCDLIKSKNEIFLEKYSFPIQLPSNLKSQDERFESVLYEKNKKTYLLFLTRNFELTYVNINDTNEIFQYDISTIIGRPTSFESHVNNDTIYFWNHNQKLLSVFKIVNNNEINFLNLYDLSRLLDWKYYYIKYQNRNTFKVINNCLFLSYGILNNPPSYLDNYAFMKINLLDSNKISTPHKIGIVPKYYINGNRYLYDIYLNNIDSNNIVLFYQSSDSVYALDLNSKILKSLKFSSDSHFPNFDRNREQDLSYVRQYSQLTEVNEFALKYSNSYLIAKRKERNDYQEEKMFTIYIFDSVLMNKKILTCEKLISPSNLYKYKSGIVRLDTTTSKAYYYEY